MFNCPTGCNLVSTLWNWTVAQAARTLIICLCFPSKIFVASWWRMCVSACTQWFPSQNLAGDERRSPRTVTESGDLRRAYSVAVFYRTEGGEDKNKGLQTPGNFFQNSTLFHSLKVLFRLWSMLYHIFKLINSEYLSMRYIASLQLVSREDRIHSESLPFCY